MLHSGICALFIIYRDACRAETCDLPAKDYYRSAGIPDCFQSFMIIADGIEDDAVDLFLDEDVDILCLFVDLAITVAEDGRKVIPLRGILDDLYKRRKDRIHNVGDYQAEGLCSPRFKRPCYDIGLILQTFDGLPYPALKLLRDSPLVVDDPGDSRYGNTRYPGYIFDCRRITRHLKSISGSLNFCPLYVCSFVGHFPVIDGISLPFGVFMHSSSTFTPVMVMNQS